MGRHASGQVSWTDTVAAYWTLILAWLSAWTPCGKHTPGHGKTPVADLTVVVSSEIQWPDGANLRWAEELHSMQSEVGMRDEVKA